MSKLVCKDWCIKTVVFEYLCVKTGVYRTSGALILVSKDWCIKTVV